MKKHKIIVLIAIMLAVVISTIYFVGRKTGRTCNDVKEVVMPSDESRAPNDVVSGQNAVNICKQQGLNARGEGGRYIYKF
jgi:uncharacterized protein YxeA